MARESISGHKPYGRRKARSECKGSDESDKDYMIDENEFDESEDEYSSFVGDESEESLGECEEEEELGRKKVKKVTRQRAPRRKKNRAVKPRKRKRVSYREDDDEDYDYDDENDEDFKPDEVYGVDDDDVELPITKGNKKLGRARLHKAISKGGEEDEEEDELPMTKGNKKLDKPQFHKGIAKREEDDDDEFLPDEVDGADEEEDELPVIKRNKKVGKTRLHKGFAKGEEEDDDDDVEFTPDEVAGAEEEEDDDEFTPDEVDGADEEDELPVINRNKKVGKTRLHKCFAKGEEEDDDDDVEFTPDEAAGAEEEDDDEFKPDEVDGADDEEDELPVIKRNKKVANTRLHKGIAKGEEEDDDDDVEFTPDEVAGAEEEEEEEEEDDEFTRGEVDGADEEGDELPVTKRNKKVGKTRLHKGISQGEDNDDEYDDDDGDEEFTLDEVDGADYEEDELPMTKRKKKLGKTRLQKGISNGEEDDDDGFTSDEVEKVGGVDDEDELPLTTGDGKLGEEQLRKAIAKEKEYDDDNDDDYEFTLDEVDDLEDEEDELPKMKGSRKLLKGIAKGEQSKTTSKVSKKITRGKSRNKCGVKRKERVDEEGKINDMSSLEEKNKIIVEGRRNRRLIKHSDSDSVSSGPLDYDYTISEEEREQVREASEFCGGLTADWRCPAISKDLMKETLRLQKKRSRRKDKEKVEEWKTEAGKQVCGICLSEEGKRRLRGTLNCCSHYFCFACIVEWSKVESRCPLCKQRFVTISKPAKSNSGFDLRTVVIQVPERDQVYQPSEEELRGYLDPYENVICTECHQGGDDALMLLCDICDSPAHTFCVGLGHEVPEGNWYCEGCRDTALDSLNQQNLNLTPENRTSNNFSVGSSPVTNVRETFDLNEMYVPETPLTQEACHVPSPRIGPIGQSALPALGSVASTVSDRRRIQRQIHQILINSSRMRQIDNRTTGVMSSVTGNDLFGSQIGQMRELAPQPIVTLERAPRTSFLHGRRLPESNSGLSQSMNMNAFAATSSHLNEQSFQNQPSTSVQSSFNGLFQGEFGAINSDMGSGLVHQQLHPCSSRPNIVPDASTSPYQFREATVPSRTWHGGYTHHFS